MKIFSGLFGLLVLFFVLSFALSNRQEIVVALWPFADAVTLPLYAVGLAPLFFGLIFGGLWGWIGGVPHRLRARRLNKELGALNEKIGELKKSSPQTPSTATKSSLWRHS